MTLSGRLYAVALLTTTVREQHHHKRFERIQFYDLNFGSRNIAKFMRSRTERIVIPALFIPFRRRPAQNGFVIIRVT